MTKQIDQKDINNTAWAACDTFRGVVDPAQYKDYILVMLFLKYISDVWQDHYDDYKKRHGDDDERIRRKLERERFVLPLVTITEEDKNRGKRSVKDTFPATFYSLYERRSASNIGELLNIVLDHIEEANKSKLEGVFRNIDFNSEVNLGKTKDRNRRLKQLLKDFNKPQLNMKPDFVSEDVIGNTYIYLIERFASDSGKKAGEFFTPLKVTSRKAKSILEKITQIGQMERGKICCLKNRKHYNHQTWRAGRNEVRYVRCEEMKELQEAIKGYAQFKKLSEEYADEIIRLSRVERAKRAKRKSK